MTTAPKHHHINIDVINNLPVISTLDIVKQTIDGEITSEKIVKRNSSLIKLVDTHIQDFEEFGKVSFEMRPSLNHNSRQTIKTAHLNEEQYFLLMTYQRNTKKVREFKINATKAFFAMKEKLYGSAISTSNDALHFNELKQELTQHIDEKLNNFSEILNDYHLGSKKASFFLQRATSIMDQATEAIQDLPLDKDQLKLIREEISHRGRHIASSLGISSESAIPALYIKLNKHFDVSSYHEIPRSSYYLAINFIRTANL